MSSSRVIGLLEEYHKNELMAAIMDDSLTRGIGQPGLLERIVTGDSARQQSIQQLYAYDAKARELGRAIRELPGGAEAIEKIDQSISAQVDSLRKQGY